MYRRYGFVLFVVLLGAMPSASLAQVKLPEPLDLPPPTGSFQAEMVKPLVSSFCAQPAISSLDKVQAGQIVVLGVPFDLGTTGRPGARLGPAAIRAASPPFQRAVGIVDHEVEHVVLKGVEIVDAGDVDIQPSDSLPNFDRITLTVGKILEQGAFPVILGGDHAITFPVLRAYERLGRKVHIIHIDAHHDFTDHIGAIRYSHGSPMIRSSELPWVSGITSIGVRYMDRVPERLAQAQAYGDQIIPAAKAIRLGMKAVVESIPAADAYYVTLDVDSMDPSVAPGTGTPVPGGFTFYQVREALLEIAAKGKVVGFDVVEVAPPFDPGQNTSLVAAYLVLDFLGAYFPNKP